jgi:DNA invertase Pin-like site-specific DNA recombinase
MVSLMNNNRIPTSSTATVRPTSRAQLREVAKYFAGKPLTEDVAHGAPFLHVKYDERGSGIACVRLSSEDQQRGVTLLGHVKQTMQLCERHGLLPRHVVAVVECSGRRPYEARPDFHFVSDAIANDGTLEWVAWRQLDRVGRNHLALELFFRMLQEGKIALYVGDEAFSDGPIDWRKSSLTITMLVALAVEEAKKILERTHGSVFLRYIEPGLGLPYQCPFGFTKNERHELAEDPRAWEIIHYLFSRYADDRIAHISYAVLSREVEQKYNVRLKGERIARILADEGYVTGQFYFTWRRERHPYRRLALSRPVDEALFEAAQRRRGAAQGRYEKTPRHTYPLNHILFYHVACAEPPEAQRPLLRARHYQRSWRYKHWPATPKEPQCRGLSIPAELVDSAVMQALRAQAAALPDSFILSQEREAELKARIDATEALHEQAFQRVMTEPDRAKAFDDFNLATIRIEKNREAAARELAVSRYLATTARSIVLPRTREQQLDAFNTIMTDEPPADPFLRELRYWITRSCLSGATLTTNPESNQLSVTLHGPIVSQGVATSRPIYPLQAARPYLEAYALRRRRATEFFHELTRNKRLASGSQNERQRYSWRTFREPVLDLTAVPPQVLTPAWSATVSLTPPDSVRAWLARICDDGLARRREQKRTWERRVQQRPNPRTLGRCLQAVADFDRRLRDTAPRSGEAYNQLRRSNRHWPALSTIQLYGGLPALLRKARRQRRHRREDGR